MKVAGLKKKMAFKDEKLRKVEGEREVMRKSMKQLQCDVKDKFETLQELSKEVCSIYNSTTAQ